MKKIKKYRISGNDLIYKITRHETDASNALVEAAQAGKLLHKNGAFHVGNKAYAYTNPIKLYDTGAIELELEEVPPGFESIFHLVE